MNLVRLLLEVMAGAARFVVLSEEYVHVFSEHQVIIKKFALAVRGKTATGISPRLSEFLFKYHRATI